MCPLGKCASRKHCACVFQEETKPLVGAEAVRKRKMDAMWAELNGSSAAPALEKQRPKKKRKAGKKKNSKQKKEKVGVVPSCSMLIYNLLFVVEDACCIVGRRSLSWRFIQEEKGRNRFQNAVCGYTEK